MKLASVRALKDELRAVEKSGSRVVLAYNVREAPALDKSTKVASRVPRAAAALGVAPNPKNPKEFRLAVRAYKGESARARTILEESSLKGKMDEVDWQEGVRYEPRGLTLRAGGSCGHYNVSAGTLGAFVEDDDAYYILSNNHVLADRDRGVEGDPILQPGPADITGRYDIIGELSRWVSLGHGRVDAALAEFTEDIASFYPYTYTGIGAIDPRPIEDRYEAFRVTKRGRTTGVTRGTISAFELDGVQINYGTRTNPRWVTFNDQIEFVGTPETKPFSQPGDSGSLILERDSLRPLALLYAGGPDADGIDRTLAHYIGDVLDDLEVRFVQ
jgi:hypothetical protein